MSKVVILNGPPLSGKDTLADYIAERYCFINTTSFKKALDVEVCNYYNVSADFLQSVSSRENKELPQERFNGLSARGARIHVSEDIFKPEHGKDVFGRLLAFDLLVKGGAFVISDGGFTEEISALVDSLGAENVSVIRILRDGCTFEGDSRNYFTNAFLEDLGVDFDDLVNDSTEDDFLINGSIMVLKMLAGGVDERF